MPPPHVLHRPTKAVYPRTFCAVRGCRHTSACFPDEWMCAFHWRRLTRVERRVLRRIWRLIRKVGRPADRQWQPGLGHLRAREYRCWCWAKRAVA